ncbi:MAG: hypothetical protein G01um101430_720 [Parcubacteria group bacterium Gr01-1014_30]|nr:MAG: hypothetical protein G01um101430_720 [Parcubacteria group bacterium Gr01-1014_30]
MAQKILILYVPVIHKGYLDFFDKIKNRASKVYLIDAQLQEELSDFKPDIASIKTSRVKALLGKLGFKNISILSKSGLGKLNGKEFILVDEEISRNFAGRYLKKSKISWQSVFLRWDKSKVLVQVPPKDFPVSKSVFDRKMMAETGKEAQKSSDWWRQIGAVLVKHSKIVLRGNNKSLPSDHTPYQVGEARDFFKAGERQDISNTIHAEQMIISKAAKKGISLQGSSLYVTVFPCPVCAKLIAFSGIKNLYFASGGSNFDAKKVLESAKVKITYVK